MTIDDHGNYVPDVPFRQPSYEWPYPFPPSRSVTHYHVGSVQEQMGVDGASKLAAAIERLCDILENGGGSAGRWVV